MKTMMKMETHSCLIVFIFTFLTAKVGCFDLVNHSDTYKVIIGHDAKLSWNYKLAANEKMKLIVIHYMSNDNDKWKALALKNNNKSIVYFKSYNDVERFKEESEIEIDDYSTVELTLKDVDLRQDDNMKFKVKYEFALNDNDNERVSETTLMLIDVPKINKGSYKKIHYVRENTDVTLPCKAKGIPLPNITWFNHDLSQVLASGIGRQSLKLEKLKRRKGGNYTCVASNIAGNDTYQVSVVVKYSPEINTTLSTSSVGTYLNNPKPVYLYCVADGNPLPKYKWNNVEGHEVTGEGTYFVLQQPRQEDFGKFTCEAINDVGSVRHNIDVYEISKPTEVKMTIAFIERRSASISLDLPISLGGGSRKAVYLSYRGKGKIKKKTLTKITKSVPLINLIPHTKYELNITVKNEYFESDGQKKVFTTKEDVPGPPSNVMLSVLSSRAMKLSWKVPREENGKITKYKVNFTSTKILNETNRLNYTDIIDANDALFKEVSGLQPYTEYIACVIAATSIGYGDHPVCVVATTEAEAPGIPQNITSNFADDKPNTISISWLPPPTRGVALLTHYTVNVTCTSREDHKIKPKLQEGKVDDVAQNSLRQLDISKLSPYSICSLQIREGAGSPPKWGNYSSFPEKIFMRESAPGKPKNLTLQRASPDYLLIAWERPNRINGELKKFVIHYADPNGVEDTKELSKDLTNKTFYYKLADLKQETKYTVRIAVHTENYDTDSAGLKMETTRKTPATQFALEQKLEEGNSGPIIGGVLTVIFILVLAAGIFLYIARKKKRFNRSTSASSDAGFFEKHGSLVDGHMTAPVLKSTFMMSNDYEKNAQCTFCPKNPVPITCLKDLVQKYHENKEKGFSDEFRSVKCDKVGSLDISSRSENKCKNRYANILAYDHSRVVLNTVEDLEGSDYVNANYIDGYNKKAKFIATQGPVVAAFNDFWRMIWEQDASKIIMVTNLVEKSRIKCQKYWPESENGEMYGDIKVEMVDELPLAEYVVRRFSITQMKDAVEVSSRTVTQYQFLSWPDHGVPQYPTALLQFVKRVRALDEGTSGPIVCHCSAGVGRTGTYITLDAMLDQIETEKTVDVLGYVTHIRSQRQLMVQTEAQYVYIYDTLLEAVSCGDTEVNTVDLFSKIKHLDSINPGSTRTYMQEEFERVSLNIDDSNQYEAALLPCNVAKNRHPNILPFEQTRVKLWPYANIEGSDYINASFIDGYQQREAYILTQSPLENTVEEFWRMLWEYEIFTIVMISSETERSKHHCWPYWPLNNDSTLFGILAVQLAAEEDKGGFIRREFRVINSKNGDTRTISHFMYFNWPNEGSPETAPAIEMIGQVQKTQQKTGNSAIVIHCSDGSSRSGSLAALMYCLERLKLEGLVDVFQTVRSMRTQRVGLVKTQEQYHFIYMAVSNFLDCFSNYANFK